MPAAAATPVTSTASTPVGAAHSRAALRARRQRPAGLRVRPASSPRCPQHPFSSPCTRRSLGAIIGVMVEKLTAVAAVIGAAAAIVAAVGVLIVNGKLDRLTGRVDGNTTAITAHTNAPGLHR